MNKIVNIYWERVNLHLVLENAVSGEVCLLDEMGKKHFLEYNDNEIVINVTNITNGDMIEAGDFTLYIDDTEVYLADEIIKNLDDLSRVFKYKARFYALLVELCIYEDKSFYLNADYMMRNKKYKKLSRLEEGYGVLGKVIRIIKFMIPYAINWCYKLLRMLRKRNKTTVLFFTENSFEPVGNLGKLYEHFKADNSIVTKGRFFDKYNGASAIEKVKGVVDIAFADVIVVDNYVSFLNVLDLEKNQKVVQLWHAGVGFKAVGYPRFGKKGSPHPFKSSHRKYDLAIVDDERLIDVYSEVFARPKRIFKALGMPRLENYLTEETIAQKTNLLYNKNPDLKTRKTILFSPTFRGVTADEAYYDYGVLDLSKLYEFCKANDFMFIVKMHPFVKEKLNIPQKYSDCISDYSDYDINDLIYISDIMITDYSSCAYEFSFFNRPLVFFRYDKAIYEYLRPLHTLDVFTEKQYEVTTFEELLNICESLKEVSPETRFSNMIKRKDLCCEDISKEILGLVK